MGLFDRIYITTKCPNCGEVSSLEYQTKDGECYMHEYAVGDFFSDQLRYIECYVGCRSKTCLAWEREHSPLSHGFGYSWTSKVFLDALGCITDKVEITGKDSDNG